MTGGRSGRAGRARAGEADVDGAARRPAQGRAAGGRQASAADAERELGPRRDGETEITDGPFAINKDVLADHYILECADLDEALEQAERVPKARDGTIEGVARRVARGVAGRGAARRRRRARRPGAK
jgi:hypothetical protein